MTKLLNKLGLNETSIVPESVVELAFQIVHTHEVETTMECLNLEKIIRNIDNDIMNDLKNNAKLSRAFKFMRENWFINRSNRTYYPQRALHMFETNNGFDAFEHSRHLQSGVENKYMQELNATLIDDYNRSSFTSTHKK
jgi:hypothetical protein